MRALLVLLVLVALPARAVEGAVGLELTIGPEFALNVMGELSPVQDRLWLVLGYGLLKPPNVPATEGQPATETEPATPSIPQVNVSAIHVFSAGVDFSPHRSWLLSLHGQVSPRSYESVTLNPGALIGDRLTLSTTAQSAGAALLAGFDSAGDSAFEMGVSGGVGFTWNRVGVALGQGAFVRLREELLLYDDVWVVRPQLGISALIADRVTLSVRGGYTLYSPPDPTQVGKIDAETLTTVVDREIAERFKNRVEVSTSARLGMVQRSGVLDASMGYASAPIRFDLKSSIQVKFVRAFSLQLAWTYLRYVPGLGFGNVAALKGTFRIGSGWRLWLIASVQLDALTDTPASKADYSTTGHLSVGGEFSF